MRRLRRFAVIAGIIVIALLIVIGLVLSLSWPRSALTSVALRFFLQQRNLHVVHGSIHVGRGTVDIADLQVKDGSGNDFFLAKHITIQFEPAGLIGRSARRFGLRSVVLQQPVLRLIRLPDGTWNASALSGGGAAAPAGAAPPRQVVAPYRVTVRVQSGEVQVIDPQALVRFARAFSISAINGALAMNEGAISSGTMRAQLRSMQGTTALRGGFFENDAISFARATIAAHDVAIAPLVDAIVPSPLFAIERGRIDLQGQAYAVAYPAGAPRWHLSADAALHDGRIRVVPLIVPLRDLHGPLHFQDGLLSTTQLRGFAAGLPLTARGALQLFGGVRFALAVAQQGRLESQRRFFAFSQKLPLAGPSGLSVRIDGPVNDIRVSGALRVRGGGYGPVILNAGNASIFYNNMHLTMAAADKTIGGGYFWSDGDIDLSTATPQVSIIAQLSLPAGQVPIVANVEPAGAAQSLATLTGPLSRLSTTGYAQLTGGALRARGLFTVSPNELFLGPLLLQPGNGEFTIAARIDRTNLALTRRSFEAFAQHAPLHLSAGAFAIPDIPSFAMTLPSLSGVLDGAIFVGGDDAKPSLAANATATQLSVAGIRLQSATLRGAGRNGYVSIRQLAAQGGSAQADAHGAAAFDSSLRLRAAALEGNANADLAAIGRASPALRMSGVIQGRFFAMLDGAQWTLSAQARSSDAKISGVPVQSADATLGGRPSSLGSILANINLAGGQVSAIGNVPSAAAQGSTSGTRLIAVADHVDLGALQKFGLPLQRGSAVGIASIGGSLQQPDIRAAAALSGAYRNVPVSGDVDVHYYDGIVQSNASRVAVDNNRARLAGSIGRLGSGASPANAALDVRLQLTEADLAALNRYAGGRIPLTGAADADVRIGGTPAQPSINGSVAADTGTLRGVAFQALRGNVATYDGYLRLNQGQVQLGQSHFQVSGEIGQGAVGLHARSTFVDMSDFNDFFGGADVFAGTGAFRVNARSSNAGLLAAGGLRLDDAAVRDYALGHIETHFSSDQGALLATLVQNGPGGAATVSGRVAFRAFSHGLPEFSSATYNLKANLRKLDVDEITPLLHQEDLGLSGTLDASGTLQGTLRRPLASAHISLHDGHLRRIAINDLSGLVRTDLDSIALSDVHVATRFVNGQGRARYEFAARRVSGELNLDASDLSELTSVFKLPVNLSGRAQALLAVSGTVAKPHFNATLTGEHDTVAGLVFNDFRAHFDYVPGELNIGDTQLGLASGGHLSIKGALPIQLRPLALGPKERPVALTVIASDANLAELNTLTSPGATLDGILNAQAGLTGNAGNPSVSGVASIRNGAVRSRWETVPLRNASADLTLARDTITLRELRGQLGSGWVNINGAAHIVPAVGLRSNAGLQFYTSVTLHDANIDVPGWLSGTLNGDLSLTRSAVRPYLAGSLALNSATVPLSAIIALASGSTAALATQSGTPQNVPGVPKPQPGHTIVYGGSIFGKTTGTLTSTPQTQSTPASFSVPPIDFNVAVSAGKDVRVRGGSAIDLTADGSVVLGGSLSNPSLSGSFRAVRGQIGYFDTTFRVQQATVTFSPTEGLLPTLDASGVTNVGGTEITLTLSGRVDNLTTELTSNPPLSRDQIIATLLHAPQVASLTTGSQSEAQAALFQTAQGYFNAELTRNLLFPFESAIAQSLNLEQIALIFDPQGNLAVEVRTRFSPTVAALYRSSLTVPVTQSYGVSYRLRDYVALELLQSQPPTGITSTLINLHFVFQ